MSYPKKVIRVTPSDDELIGRELVYSLYSIIYIILRYNALLLRLIIRISAILFTSIVLSVLAFCLVNPGVRLVMLPKVPSNLLKNFLDSLREMIDWIGSLFRSTSTSHGRESPASLAVSLTTMPKVEWFFSEQGLTSLVEIVFILVLLLLLYNVLEGLIKEYDLGYRLIIIRKKIIEENPLKLLVVGSFTIILILVLILHILRIIYLISPYLGIMTIPLIFILISLIIASAYFLSVFILDIKMRRHKEGGAFNVKELIGDLLTRDKDVLVRGYDAIKGYIEEELLRKSKFKGKEFKEMAKSLYEKLPEITISVTLSERFRWLTTSLDKLLILSFLSIIYLTLKASEFLMIIPMVTVTYIIILFISWVILPIVFTILINQIFKIRLDHLVEHKWIGPLLLFLLVLFNEVIRPINVKILSTITLEALSLLWFIQYYRASFNHKEEYDRLVGIITLILNWGLITLYFLKPLFWIISLLLFKLLSIDHLSYLSSLTLTPGLVTHYEWIGFMSLVLVAYLIKIIVLEDGYSLLIRNLYLIILIILSALSTISISSLVKDTTHLSLLNILSLDGYYIAILLTLIALLWYLNYRKEGYSWKNIYFIVLGLPVLSLILSLLTFSFDSLFNTLHYFSIPYSALVIISLVSTFLIFKEEFGNSIKQDLKRKLFEMNIILLSENLNITLMPPLIEESHLSRSILVESYPGKTTKIIDSECEYF